MAKYGARYIMWAPFAEANPEPENALPNYGTPISLSKLVKVTDNPTYAEGELHGDDELAEDVSEFTKNDIDVETTDSTNEMEAAMYGATKAKDGTIAYGKDDSAPYGGLGFVSMKMVDGKKSYVGIFYPKCKARKQGEDYNTKNESITFTTNKIKLKGAAAKNGDWKLTSPEMETLALAKAWVDANFGPAA